MGVFLLLRMSADHDTIGAMTRLTVWRALPGLGLAGWLLVGIPACTPEVAVESDRVPAEREEADPNTREAATEPDRTPAGQGDADARREVATESDRILAEQGDADAQALLGVVYYNGRGVEQDYGEAVRWSRLAAEQGNARGQALLGVAYYSGHGVAQDFDEAARWARLAAEQGDAGAQVVLGTLYLNGTGVARDHVSAHAWLTLASSASGIAGARELRDRVAERMTPEQVAEAQARARELEQSLGTTQGMDMNR